MDTIICAICTAPITNDEPRTALSALDLFEEHCPWVHERCATEHRQRWEELDVQDEHDAIPDPPKGGA